MKVDSTAVALLTLAAAAGAPAQDSSRWMRECAKWVEQKGYSVDYIEQRTGERPSGNLAQDWISNLEPKEAQPGDIVFMYTGESKGQRAEVVDEVLKNADGTIRAFRTSSMNAGRMIEPRCNVTENFGKVMRRNVEFQRVVRARRVERQ